MRGSVAKRLRKEAVEKAGVLPVVSYHDYAPIRYVEDVDKDTGVVSLKRIKGIPLTLGVCQRNVYKELKAKYKLH